jgi:hypothetical protein
MPYGCSATLRSLSHLFLLLPAFGQLMWPAPHFVLFFLRSAPFRFIHGSAHCLRSPETQPTHKAMLCATRLLQQSRCSFHFISASLRHSFTSVSRSPPAAFCCYARLAATVCVTGASLAQIHPYKPGRLCHTLPLHCVSIAPCGRFTGHPSRWHSQAILRRASSIAFDGGRPGYSVDKFATPLSFFWPQALLPFCFRKFP